MTITPDDREVPSNSPRGYNTMTYGELVSYTAKTNIRMNKEDMELFLKNPIVKSAYMQGTTVFLRLEDGVSQSKTWIEVDFGTKFPEGDYSDPLKIPSGGYFFPKDVLLYARIFPKRLDYYTKNCVFISTTNTPEFLDTCEAEIKKHGAVEFPTIESRDVEKFLIEKGIRIILKDDSGIAEIQQSVQERTRNV